MKRRRYRSPLSPEELKLIKRNTKKALGRKKFNALKYIRMMEKEYIKLRGREECDMLEEDNEE